MALACSAPAMPVGGAGSPCSAAIACSVASASNCRRVPVSATQASGRPNAPFTSATHTTPSTMAATRSNAVMNAACGASMSVIATMHSV